MTDNSSTTNSTTQPLPKVLISGASIAGPALARWLGRNGFSVTVVEKSPSMRPGGQAVDFKGDTHMRLLHAMGVYDDIWAAQTSRTDWRIINAKEEVQAILPGEFLGGNVEILRGDLADILYRHSAKDAAYVFGDEVTALHDDGGGVDVEFAHRPPERFDLVIGADGVHSAVRRLAYGPEDDYLVKTGFYYAIASAPVPLENLETKLADGRAVAYAYSEPYRFACLGGQKAPSLFIFAGKEGSKYDRRSAVAQHEFLDSHFKGSGWRIPQALAAVGTTDFYMDELVRTKMDTYTRGRVALVGDAGYANTLGGFGSGLALMGAYVLSGELVKCHGDYAAAFAEYDRVMAKPASVAKTGNAGEFFCPPSYWRIWLRNLSFANSWTRAGMVWVANWMATDESMPVYDML